MKKIVIVDYGLGNLFSIKQALGAVGAEAIFSSKAEDLQNCDGILLPGVGAFADAMNRLHELNLVKVIQKAAHDGKPILGVCLGLQLLFDQSHEFGLHQGLGLIPGEVVRFPEQHNKMKLTVPFIGWNRLILTPQGKDLPLLRTLKDATNIYFVHSYYVSPKSQAEILARCEYQDFAFPAVVRYKNTVGIQGHPEKSSEQGLEIYKNWVASL
jgi:imidazole glycerol-phosphate synthase subunit HisH